MVKAYIYRRHTKDELAFRRRICNNQLPHVMTSRVRKKILKTGLIISIICLVGSIIMLTQIPPRSLGRTAMILTGITALLTGVSFYLQYRQEKLRQQEKI